MIRTTFILLLTLLFSANVAMAGGHCHGNHCCKKGHWKKEWKRDRYHADHRDWDKYDDDRYGDDRGDDYDFKRKDYGNKYHDEECCFAWHGDWNHRCPFDYKGDKHGKWIPDHSCAACHPCDR